MSSFLNQQMIDANKAARILMGVRVIELEARLTEYVYEVSSALEEKSEENNKNLVELSYVLVENAELRKRIEKLVEAIRPYFENDIHVLGSLEMAMAYPHMTDLPPEVLQVFAELESSDADNG